MPVETLKNIGAATGVEKKISLDELIFCAKKIGDEAFVEAAATDSVEKFPVETLRQITENSLLSAPLPKKFGGAGLGLETGANHALLQVLKHFGRGNPVVGRVYEGHFNALLLIKLFGSDEQIERFSNDAKNGRLFGVWNTEANDGVKIFPHENGKFRLEGAKTFATGTDFVTRPIVNGAMPDGGWQMTIVPLDETATKSDASWWNPMGMRATRSFKMDFTGAIIESKNLIGATGNYYEQPWFSGGSIRFAAVQFGAAEAIFDETRKYLQMLGRIDDPYQKMRLGEMAILIETGNLWLKSAAEKLDEFMQNPSPEKSENFLAYANMMRSAIEKICVETMNLCQKSVGARGLNKPFHFERIIRDLTIYLRQPAPDAALADAGRYVLESETVGDDLWK
jgi:alkylation response protein AidB-like acyl-CoA dehydrogenase